MNLYKRVMRVHEGLLFKLNLPKIKCFLKYKKKF